MNDPVKRRVGASRSARGRRWWSACPVGSSR